MFVYCLSANLLIKNEDEDWYFIDCMCTAQMPVTENWIRLMEQNTSR